MIDFACKQFSLKDVIKCGLALTKADYKIMEHLLRSSEDHFATQDIATDLNLNLSTVQRSVKKLHEKNIIKRSQNNLNGGGYVYYYTINEKERIVKIILDIVHNWVKKVELELNIW